MGWNDISEIIKVLGAVATAGAAWFAASIAYRGLERWRAEVIGKRKTELAEEVLSGFYQMNDIIKSIRSPLSYGEESQNRKRADFETDDEKRLKDTYYVPLARYNDRLKDIADLMTKRYRMKALFGPQAEKPFDTLHSVFSEVTIAARMLIMTAGEKTASKEKWERLIWWMGEEDAVDKKVATAIAQIETVCRPTLEGRKL